MKMKHCYTQILSAIAAAWGLHGSAFAQLVINDNLNGASSAFNWQTFNGACLTAGNNTGTIPACVGLPFYAGRIQVGGTTGRLPDTPGSGALRLTNGDTQVNGINGDNQTGSVVSNFTFPTNQGLQVTFSTVSYGGDNFNGTGADGITFFLSDGTLPPSIGSFGGSLGYSCANGKDPADGVDHAYLGVGIDEFGNFANQGDNTNTGAGFRANRISIRGAGETTWANLNSVRPAFYPNGLNASQRAAAVSATCRSGNLMNYSGGIVIDANGNSIANGSATTETLASVGNRNYPLLANSNLPINLANQQAINMPLRGNAIPINYAIKITQAGLLDFSYSVNGGAVQQVFNAFPLTNGNGPLPPSFRFGFSGGTGGGSNVHEILCFKAAPATNAGSSAGSNVQQAAVKFGTQVYLASYRPLNWWGQLTAQNFLINATTGDLSIDPTANWNAHCTLTGGICAAMTSAASTIPVSVTAQAPASRQILTWNGVGTSLAWGSLSTAQQAALSAGDTAAIGANRLGYLRGIRTGEIANGGIFRTRTGVLGDIVDSSPTWVGSPMQSYQTFADKLYPTQIAPEAGVSYASFKAANATRQNLVYVGANDGMLHAFRAGANDASGNFAGTPANNNGTEALAYMPAAVLSSIHSTTGNLDFSSPQYGHNFYVNATPATGDLFYNGAWRTWLVSGLGAGGNITGPINNSTAPAQGALFALNITDPTQFNATNAANLVLGEWSSSNITCTNVTNCGANLGSIYGTPVIRRLHNGQWAVLFGNGLNSNAGVAGIFIMLVDPASGNRSFRFLSTGAGSVAGNRNGISHISSADLDDDHITDYVYAGDAMGNLWRFDLTSDKPKTWAVSKPALFRTAPGQPITNKVVVASVAAASGNLSRLIVGIGTGQRFPQTATSAETFAPGGQSLYGIWDSNLANWNSKGSTQYATLSGTPTTATPANLRIQTVTSTTPGSATPPTPSQRTISSALVCWQGSTRCTGGSSANVHLGWQMALPGTNEQAFYSPVLDVGSGNMVVNTTIPPLAVNALSCNAPPPLGYSMAVSLTEGGASTKSFFRTGTGIINGLGISATGSPSFLKTPNGKTWMVNQVDDGTATSGGGSVVEINNFAGKSQRLNWIKLR